MLDVHCVLCVDKFGKVIFGVLSVCARCISPLLNFCIVKPSVGCLIDHKDVSTHRFFGIELYETHNFACSRFISLNSGCFVFYLCSVRSNSLKL